MENLDNSTLDMIESIIAIGVDYGVDIVGAIVMLVVGWTIAGWVRRASAMPWNGCRGWTKP